MIESQKIELAEELLLYCKRFNIPIEYLFEILGDQKVTPMIRGKATEYNAYLYLDKILPRKTWSVQKLNLNAQTGTNDEDISITHRNTGVILKVESKNAVRGSMSIGVRSKTKVPHFKVKCHRSRSNIKLADTSNDRYSIDSFDIIVTNTSNAIFEGRTIGESLELIHKQEIRDFLYEFYKTTSEESLLESSGNDWRFCIPSDIAENGFIPRTPMVEMVNDPNWLPLSMIENRLTLVVDGKWNTIKTKRQR